jgi:dihydroxyacetone kinase-like protein
VAAAIRAVAAAIDDHHVELTRLDRQIGDGDHGENMNRGFKAVVAKLDADPGLAPGGVLKLVAMTLMSTVGGASGPLYGTAFLRSATRTAWTPPPSRRRWRRRWAVCRPAARPSRGTRRWSMR